MVASAADKKKQRDRLALKYITQSMKAKKNLMTKMHKLGLGHIVISLDPQDGVTRCIYSKHFQKYVTDPKWDKGLHAAIKSILSGEAATTTTSDSSTAPQVRLDAQCKTAGDVIRKHLTQPKLLDLLRAMGAAKMRKAVRKSKTAEELEFKADTFSGSKDDSDFQAIIDKDAFKPQEEGEDEEEDQEGGGEDIVVGEYRVPTGRQLLAGPASIISCFHNRLLPLQIRWQQEPTYSIVWHGLLFADPKVAKGRKNVHSMGGKVRLSYILTKDFSKMRFNDLVALLGVLINHIKKGMLPQQTSYPTHVFQNLSEHSFSFVYRLARCTGEFLRESSRHQSLLGPRGGAKAFVATYGEEQNL